MLSLITSIAAAALALLQPGASRLGNPGSAQVSVFPKSIALAGSYQTARVIAARSVQGAPMDVTEQAAFRIEDRRIASVDPDGRVQPLGNGRTRLVITVDGRSTSIPILASLVDKNAAPSFRNDVVPVLTRAGCNMGACHGAAQGKGGLKLSLQGFDVDADYESLIRGGKHRRITPAAPSNSLLLRKPLLSVAHKGGKRLRSDSMDFRILRDWIAFGMPPPDPRDAKLERLQLVPPVRSLSIGQSQRFIALARFSDGTVRDVTSHSLFTAEDESVAGVSADGVAKAAGPGEAAVLIRYQNLVATSRVISPFNKVRIGRSAAEGSKPAGTGSGIHPIDRLINRKLAALGLPPSRRCSDSDYVRRAYLDLLGVLPTPAEALRFLLDRDLEKRARLIAELMERPEFVDFWSYRWADLLRVNRGTLKDKGAYSLYNWIRQSVAVNKPWDQFAREILLANGGTYENGPANYFRANNKPEELAETTAQAFLGVRMQCAKCHNHPHEKWTQNQYYELAAFFARSRNRGRGDEMLILAGQSGEVKHPKTGWNVQPAALGSPPIPNDYPGDRREALVDWLTSVRNPFFSRAIVNRLWRHFMGRGLVEPVDDMRLTNPPSNEPLLDWLAADFISKGFDLRAAMRTIMLSDAYQRSAEPVSGNERDTKYYSRYPFKRMRAEQMLDAIASVTGVPEKFDGFPAGFRASQLPVTTVPSYFLDLFGRPARNMTCECERMDDPNLGQVLHLMNNSGINDRIGSKDGRVAKLIERKRTDHEIVEDLYLAAFSRRPTPSEFRVRTESLSQSKDRKRAAEDLLWALMNSKEFIFIH